MKHESRFGSYSHDPTGDAVNEFAGLKNDHGFTLPSNEEAKLQKIETPHLFVDARTPDTLAFSKPGTSSVGEQASNWLLDLPPPQAVQLEAVVSHAVEAPELRNRNDRIKWNLTNAAKRGLK